LPQYKLNDVLAQSTLGTLATASETFATLNDGKYPSSIDDISYGEYAYISLSTCDQTISGYSYSCEMSDSGYTFVATPTTVGESGTTTYTMTTGAILVPKE